MKLIYESDVIDRYNKKSGGAYLSPKEAIRHIVADASNADRLNARVTNGDVMVGDGNNYELWTYTIYIDPKKDRDTRVSAEFTVYDRFNGNHGTYYGKEFFGGEYGKTWKYSFKRFLDREVGKSFTESYYSDNDNVEEREIPYVTKEDAYEISNYVDDFGDEIYDCHWKKVNKDLGKMVIKTSKDIFDRIYDYASEHRLISRNY